MVTRGQPPTNLPRSASPTPAVSGLIPLVLHTGSTIAMISNTEDAGWLMQGQKRTSAALGSQPHSPRRSPRAHAAIRSPGVAAAAAPPAPLVNKPRLGVHAFGALPSV